MIQNAKAIATISRLVNPIQTHSVVWPPLGISLRKRLEKLDEAICLAHSHPYNGGYDSVQPRASHEAGRLHRLIQAQPA